MFFSRGWVVAPVPCVLAWSTVPAWWTSNAAARQRTAVHPFGATAFDKGQVDAFLPALPPAGDVPGAPCAIIELARLGTELASRTHTPAAQEHVCVNVARVAAALHGGAMHRPFESHLVFAAKPMAVIVQQGGMCLGRKFARQGEDDASGDHGVSAALGSLGRLPVRRSHDAGGQHFIATA